MVEISDSLRESEERYRNLVESSPDAIGLYNKKGNIIFINNAGAKLFGVDKPGNLIEKSLLDFCVPEEREATRQFIETVLVKKMPPPPGYVGARKLLRPNGELRDVEVAGAIVKHKGEAVVQFQIRDVTERKRSEVELKKHAEELEKMNKFMLGRELKMSELKEEIERLKKK